MANDNLMQTRFGSREICNVTFRTKAAKKIGGVEFKKDQPVFIFDSLKTSTLESAATTVYATGGRGNTRLVAWEGEKTVTFTMEDALISPLTFSILSGAGVKSYTSIEANQTTTNGWNLVHFSATGKCEKIMAQPSNAENTNGSLVISFKDDLPYWINSANNRISEIANFGSTDANYYVPYLYEIDEYGNLGSPISGFDFTNYPVVASNASEVYALDALSKSFTNANEEANLTIKADKFYLFDGYCYAPTTELTVGPEDFAGSYYIEADTLFREESTGEDKPAQFIIPHGKVQSSYTFSMAATGDPSTFTFTVDAFPDYTKFDRSRKVLFALNILG